MYHVNFHTYRNRPVFESAEYLSLAETAFADVLTHWAIPCVAWTIMPTHVHLMVVTFPDQQLGKILNLIKGRTSRGVLDVAPELRGDLGNHLWQEGYHWVLIKDQRQCANTIRYIRENRRQGGLE
jgi:REP element-mobilizing transposase RayT